MWCIRMASWIIITIVCVRARVHTSHWHRRRRRLKGTETVRRERNVINTQKMKNCKHVWEVWLTGRAGRRFGFDLVDLTPTITAVDDIIDDAQMQLWQTKWSQAVIIIINSTIRSRCWLWALTRRCVLLRPATWRTAAIDVTTTRTHEPIFCGIGVNIASSKPIAVTF